MELDVSARGATARGWTHEHCSNDAYYFGLSEDSEGESPRRNWVGKLNVYHPQKYYSGYLTHVRRDFQNVLSGWPPVISPPEAVKQPSLHRQRICLWCCRCYHVMKAVFSLATQILTCFFVCLAQCKHQNICDYNSIMKPDFLIVGRLISIHGFVFSLRANFFSID